MKLNRSKLMKIGIGIAIFLFLYLIATISSNFSLEDSNCYEGYLMDIKSKYNIISVAKDTSVNVRSWAERENYHCFKVEDTEAISKIESALQEGYPFVTIRYVEGVAGGPRQIGEHSYQFVYKIEMNGEIILYDPGTWKDFLCISVTLAILIIFIKVMFGADNE